MLIGLWRSFVYDLGCLDLMWGEENRTRVVLAQCIELMGTESQVPETKRKPNG